MGRGRHYTKTNYGMDERENRVILLIDMDYYEVQVYQKYNGGPDDDNCPRVVVNSKNRILSLSPEAKELGITRKGTKYFPEAEVDKYDRHVIRYVADSWPSGRPKSTKVMEATHKTVEHIRLVLRECQLPLTATFEYSSKDEFYVEFTYIINDQRFNMEEWHQRYGRELYTENINKIGFNEPSDPRDVRLLFGGIIAAKIRDSLMQKLNYSASVGVGLNKLVAKIACGLNKPYGVTIVSPSGFDEFCDQVNIEEIPGLGGGLSIEIKEQLGITKMSQLRGCYPGDLKPLISQLNLRMNSEKKVHEILHSAAGLCFKIVRNRPFIHHAEIKRDFLYDFQNQVYPRTLHRILEEQLDELEERLEFERQNHCRNPRKVKLHLKAMGSESWYPDASIKNPSERREERKKFFKNALTCFIYKSKHKNWRGRGKYHCPGIVLSIFYPGSNKLKSDYYDNPPNI